MAYKLEDMKPVRMADDEKQLPRPSKITVPTTNMDSVKKPNTNATTPSSSPKLQRALTRPPSGRWNCLCSPTTHVGSFRCRFHRSHGMSRGGSVGSNLSELDAKSRSISDLMQNIHT
ncbi:uncharacterized protein LOC126688145 [Mercurialis annua]|uniref:uncharacterized protein LOC126688145 n=1 Tax=Mercurialis annua TaxID=3986 RepID=UPI00215E6945|nr:uncharacterized protein LOC126688145 [Mercurialis annua]